MTNPFYIYDVFTTTRFCGNPLAVVGNADALSDESMQKIAMEFGFSETVFLKAPTSQESVAQLRIFTPVRELPFAGHPVIGTSILMRELMGGQTQSFQLDLGLGPCPIEFSQADEAVVARLTAPKNPEKLKDFNQPEQLASLFGLQASDFIQTNHAGGYSAGNEFLVCEVASRKALAALKFDKALSKDLGFRSAYCLYRETSQGETRLHARMMSSEDAITEDPATGSAAAAVPAYEVACNPALQGQQTRVISQGEDMGRPSRIELGFSVKDGALEQVTVAGSAVKVASGELDLG